MLLSADLGPEATERIIERLREQAGAAAGPGEYRRIMAEELLSIIRETPAPEPPKGRPSRHRGRRRKWRRENEYHRKARVSFQERGDTRSSSRRATPSARRRSSSSSSGRSAPECRSSGRSGADPAAVAFDAVQSAKARNVDIVIVDTAGRLHTKVNLMDELRKIFNVLSTRMEGIGLEGWLVLDANTGQNSLRQAEAFTAALPISGLVLTKLDSTAKGGAIVTIQRKLRVPVIYVGVGEGLEDIERFDPELFVSAMLGE